VEGVVDGLAEGKSEEGELVGIGEGLLLGAVEGSVTEGGVEGVLVGLAEGEPEEGDIVGIVDGIWLGVFEGADVG